MKRYSKLLRVLALIAIGLVAVLPTIPVCADTPDPDSTPTVEEFNVYRNLLETDDFLLLIYANIPYATPPSDPVTETFIWRMIDTDNITELGSTTGFNYHDNGYGFNVFSMYWGAANITALGIAWGTEYTIRLSGNPAAFDDPPKYDFTLDSTDYTDSVAGNEVREEMGNRLLSIASELKIKWALAADYCLTQEIETGTVLSIYGETVFRGVIRGVQGMVPQIFRFVVSNLDVGARTWDPTYVTALEEQWTGTWVETARAAGATLFGTSYDLTSLILLTGLAFGVVIGNLMVSGDTWAGGVDACFVLLIGTKLTLLGLGYLGLIVSLCVLYIAARMWGLARG